VPKAVIGYWALPAQSSWVFVFLFFQRHLCLFKWGLHLDKKRGWWHFNYHSEQSSNLLLTFASRFWSGLLIVCVRLVLSSGLSGKVLLVLANAVILALSLSRRMAHIFYFMTLSGVYISEVIVTAPLLAL
jgi:hypothetical protein